MIVPADEIMAAEADVFSPCALGAVLDKDSIGKLKAGIVAGGANNQLATKSDGSHMRTRNILSAPDYVINAGGIINVALEYLGKGDRAEVNSRIEQIPERLTDRSEEHKSELQSLMRISYDVFCLKKKS